MGIRPMWTAPVAGLIAAATMLVSAASANTAIRFSGDVSGLVSDAAGRPQAGAVVMLFNKQDRLLQRLATDRDGTFSFDDLLPDLYTVRVSFSSFFPASRDHIQVRSGMRSLLEVNLSRLFSSVQLVATTPAPGGLMSDSWKWTLRADNSLRPILRFLPQAKTTIASTTEERKPVFSDSRGIVRISAADGAQVLNNNGEADLGTQFAFSTSVYGENHVAVTGDVGYAPVTGAPATAIRATYGRKMGDESDPLISITMRQFYVPVRPGQAASSGSGSDASFPGLRTLGFSYSDKRRINDVMSIEYGSEMDIVSFTDRMQYFSPYARLMYAIPHGTVDFTYTSGNPRPELGLSAVDGDADLQRDLEAVSMVPRLTMLNGRDKVEYGEDFETGVTEKFGSREYRASVYRENVSNTALTIANPVPGMFAGDVMPDLFSPTALFNAGQFQTTGYTLSVTQNLGENYKLTAMYGSLGVLSTAGDVNIETANDLRAALESQHRGAFDIRGSGKIRATGTQFAASYEFTDYRSALPAPVFSTQTLRPEPGLNIVVRQPIPGFPGMPGRFEASAEVRNLLAQGYMPLTIGGQSILLVNTPRSFRGGVAFVF